MKIFLKKHALDFLGNLLMCGPNKIKNWMEKKTLAGTRYIAPLWHLPRTIWGQFAWQFIQSVQYVGSPADPVYRLFCLSCQCYHQSRCNLYNSKKSFVAHVKRKQFLRSHMYFVGKTWGPTLHCIHPVGGHCYFTGSCNFEPLLSPTFSLLLQNTKKKKKKRGYNIRMFQSSFEIMIKNQTNSSKYYLINGDV